MDLPWSTWAMIQKLRIWSVILLSEISFPFYIINAKPSIILDKERCKVYPIKSDSHFPNSNSQLNNAVARRPCSYRDIASSERTSSLLARIWKRRSNKKWDWSQRPVPFLLHQFLNHKIYSKVARKSAGVIIGIS